jgi:hypothetical protein
LIVPALLVLPVLPVLPALPVLLVLPILLVLLDPACPACPAFTCSPHQCLYFAPESRSRAVYTLQGYPYCLATNLAVGTILTPFEQVTHQSNGKAEKPRIICAAFDS